MTTGVAAQPRFLAVPSAQWLYTLWLGLSKGVSEIVQKSVGISVGKRLEEDISMSDELGSTALLVGIQHDLSQWKRGDRTCGQVSGLWPRLDSHGGPGTKRCPRHPACHDVRASPQDVFIVLWCRPDHPKARSSVAVAVHPWHCGWQMRQMPDHGFFGNVRHMHQLRGLSPCSEPRFGCSLVDWIHGHSVSLCVRHPWQRVSSNCGHLPGFQGHAVDTHLMQRGVVR